MNWQSLVGDLNAYYQQQEGDWRSAFAPLFDAIIEDQGNLWNAQLGTSFAVTNVQSAEWFNQYTLTFAQQVNQTTTQALGDLFMQAQVEGWTIDQMQNRMTDLFTQWQTGDATSADFDWYAQRLPPWRTELIARTETIRSANYGSLNLFKEWDPNGKKGWSATYDDRTREDHAQAAQDYGEEGAIPYDQPFIVGGIPMDCPGDPNAPIEQVANCRCALIPVLSSSE